MKRRLECEGSNSRILDEAVVAKRLYRPAASCLKKTTTNVAPAQFLINLLRARGYSVCHKFSEEIGVRRRFMPSSKELLDYDNELRMAVSKSDFEALKKLHAEGKRKSEFEVVRYVITNSADLNIIDDYGRNPLHDACWRIEPNFDIISLILEKDVNLLLMEDVRGCTPLAYVRSEDWMKWCFYLYNNRDRFWPLKS